MLENATEEIRNLDRKINSSKKYKVEAKYEEGIIYKVIISENEKRRFKQERKKKMNDEKKKEKRKAKNHDCYNINYYNISNIISNNFNI